MAHGTPSADSILASELSTGLGLVSSGHRITWRSPGYGFGGRVSMAARRIRGVRLPREEQFEVPSLDSAQELAQA